MRRWSGVLILAAVLPTRTASAQSYIQFNRPGSGARAAGMANAFIGISDDGTAASWNPAGLGQLRKPELSVVTNTIGRSATSQGFRMRDDSAVFTAATADFHTWSPDFVSLAAPVTLAGRPVTFQGAWRRLYFLDARQNTETRRQPLTPDGPAPAAFRSNADLTGSIDLWSLAAAVKLTPRVAFGASFNLWDGTWLEEEAMIELPDGGAPEFRTLSQHNRIDGDSFTVGLMLTYPRWSVGIVHLTPMTSRFFGEGVELTSFGGGMTPDGKPLIVDGTLRFSRGFGAGAAWRPVPQWTIATDVTWDDWTGATLEVPADDVVVSIFDNLPLDRTATRDTLSFNAGAERLFHGEGYVVPLRFGAAIEPQGGRHPYTRDPVTWVMLAAGTGYNTNTLKFDAALQYRWTSFLDGGHFTVVPPTSGELPMAVGERSLREWRIKLSVIVRVTDTEKLGQTLRKIFGGDS